MVRIAAASDPASASESAKAAISSPLAQRGRNRWLQLLRAEARDRQRAELLTISISAQEASARAISSTAICSISVPVPVPPYSLVERQREDVVFRQQLADVLGVGGAAIDLGGARGDPLAGDPRDRLAQLEQLGRDRTHRGALAYS